VASSDGRSRFGNAALMNGLSTVNSRLLTFC
jgi:hypothetical protein